MNQNKIEFHENRVNEVLEYKGSLSLELLSENNGLMEENAMIFREKELETFENEGSCILFEARSFSISYAEDEGSRILLKEGSISYNEENAMSF